MLRLRAWDDLSCSRWKGRKGRGKDRPEFSSGWSRGAHTQHLDPQVTTLTRTTETSTSHRVHSHTHNIKHGINYENIIISVLAVLAIMAVGSFLLKAYFNQITGFDNIRTELYPV